MRSRKIGQLANAGSSGNNTHNSIPIPADTDVLDLEFEITAVGTTVSWLFQASEDPPEVSDANSDWRALSVLPGDANAEIATAQTKTAVGVYSSSVELSRRPLRKVRLVTSANTGCTYESEAYGVELDN